MLGGRVVQQLMSGYDRVQLSANIRHLDTDYSRGRLVMKHYNSLILRLIRSLHCTDLLIMASSLSPDWPAVSVRESIVGKF